MNKNLCKLLKNARHKIIIKYYGECTWQSTEADYIEDLIRTHLLDNGYTTQDLSGDASDIDDSQLKDFQTTVTRILEDLSRVYDGNILCYTYDYLTHFTEYHLDIDTILEYYYSDQFLAILSSAKLYELNYNTPTSSSTLIEILCNEAWKFIISDYVQLLTTEQATILLNEEED